MYPTINIALSQLKLVCNLTVLEALSTIQNHTSGRNTSIVLQHHNMPTHIIIKDVIENCADYSERLDAC